MIKKRKLDFYPFGLSHGSLNNLHLNKYLYGGKEYQDAEINGSLLGLYDFHARYYNPMLGRWFNQDPVLQFTNPYFYCHNNPMMYVDKDGEFITWFFGKKGFSIGFNFGFFGFGINIGWSDGGSIGVYGELGPRAGGTGFGSGATVSQSLDFSLRSGSCSTSTSAGAYASCGPFNVSASASYDWTHDSFGWNTGAGVNIFGSDEWGVGLNIGYGSGGWTYGAGGYYNPSAWDSNPTYEPDSWNDESIIDFNNCYSYALDDIDNGNYRGLQPGNAGGSPITSYDDINIGFVTDAAVSDGRAKKPNFWNKLGFGKRGFYSVYLVVDEGIDYHWYRQDKGGQWSHKPGLTAVKNTDGSGRIIRNPARANHNYRYYNGNGNLILNLR